MDKKNPKVFDLWKTKLTDHIKDYTPYAVPGYLDQIAAFFAPGSFYYYILNFHNLEIDFVSKGTKEVLGVEPEDFSIHNLVQMFPPEDVIDLEKKESLICDFFYNFLSPEIYSLITRFILLPKLTKYIPFG